MKVFHGIQNIGGMAGVLARAQRDLGVDAISYCLPTGPYHYESDRVLQPGSLSSRTIETCRFVLRNCLDIQVFHFYFGESLSGARLTDVRWLKALGKKVFFNFCGCDIRDSKATIAKYEISACRECWPMACSANRKSALATASRYADGIFVSTPDLLEFAPDSSWLPQPVDLQAIAAARDERAATEPAGENQHDKFIVAHGPSNRLIKGTRHLQNAVDELKNQGLPIELVLIEDIPHHEALTRYVRADLVVDQLLVGSYGLFAVEMMALAKPVVCFLRDDLVDLYPPELPIINAHPGNIAHVLRNAYENRQHLHLIGERGTRYAEAIHDSHIVARRTIDAYGPASNQQSSRT